MPNMIDEKLVGQYSGPGADSYDRQREQTPRFKAEEQAFARLFGKVMPDWVVDCPVGTGRWLESYRLVSGRVTGIDASSAMLAQAKVKYGVARVEIALVEGSIFDAMLFESLRRSGRGLVVCIRFINWIPMTQVSEALRALSGCSPASMIIGASVRPVEWGSLKQVRAKAALARLNVVARLKRMSLPRVHDERQLLGEFARIGLRVHEREHIFEDSARVNYFYRLELDRGTAGT